MGGKKNSQPVRNRGNYFNLRKSIYKNITFNIFNDERMNAFPLRSGTREGYLLSLSLFNILLTGSSSYCNKAWIDEWIDRKRKTGSGEETVRGKETLGGETSRYRGERKGKGQQGGGFEKEKKQIRVQKEVNCLYFYMTKLYI